MGMSVCVCVWIRLPGGQVLACGASQGDALSCS